jgi:hypothetical protein
MRTIRIARDTVELVRVLDEMKDRGFKLDHIENMIDTETLTVSFKIVYK